MLRIWLYSREMSPKDVDGIANSEDPDQTAPRGAVWSGSALFEQTYLSQNLGSLRHHNWVILKTIDFFLNFLIIENGFFCQIYTHFKEIFRKMHIEEPDQTAFLGVYFFQFRPLIKTSSSTKLLVVLKLIWIFEYYCEFMNFWMMSFAVQNKFDSSVQMFKCYTIQYVAVFFLICNCNA